MWLEVIVTLARPSGHTSDVNFVTTPTYGTPYYGDGESEPNASIWTVNRGPQIFLGDAGSLETRTATVQLRWDAPKVAVDDMLTVVSCPYDIDMVGRTGIVESVGGGGRLRGSRIITVKGLYESKDFPT